MISGDSKDLQGLTVSAVQDRLESMNPEAQSNAISTRTEQSGMV